MRNFLRIATGINTTPLLLSIARQPELFNIHDFRQTTPGSPHHSVEDILLRCQPLDGSLPDFRESINYEAFRRLPEARRLIMGLMADVEGERLGRVMITRLKFPNTIAAHCDVGDTPLHYEKIRYWGRYHIVLQSDPAAVFRCDDDLVHMAPGECWYFRNDLEHEVFWMPQDEAPQTERIHVIADIHTANEPVR